MSSHPSRTWRHIGRSFGTVVTVASIALACMLPPAAFGANPVEEMAKQKTTIGGGIDPHGRFVALHAAQPRAVLASGIHTATLP